MARTPLDALVTERALALVYSNHFDVVGELSDPKDLKNVCAKLPTATSDRIDAYVSILGVSKRQWLEAAIVEALDKTEQILQAEGFFEQYAALKKHLEEGK